MSPLWLLSFLFFSTLLSNVQGMSRITGTGEAVAGEFPFVVSILLGGRHHCSGFIYNDLYIVTTASCVVTVTPGNPPTVTPISPRQLTIVAGEFNLNIPEGVEQELLVVNVVPNENYNPGNQLNNIALLMLSRPITFTSFVNFIKYDVVNAGLANGITMGWGGEADGGPLSLKLKKTSVTMRGDCAVYSGSVSINETFIICAGAQVDPGHPCNMDDGGPLVQGGDTVVGILSYQRTCGANPFYSAIYTRLSTYAFWIRENAGNQPTLAPTTQRTTTKTPGTKKTVTRPGGGYFECPDETPNGRFPITPETCSPQFYFCNNGDAFLENCPTGSIFDPILLICVDPKDANCGFTCPPDNDGSGFYAIPGKCVNEFYICVSFTVYDSHCPGIAIFDPVQGICFSPSNPELSCRPTSLSFKFLTED